MANDFYSYQGGIYNAARSCRGLTNSQVTHAMLLVGYDVRDAAAPYWILKNSWGDRWGIGGYVKVRGRPDGWLAWVVVGLGVIC